MPKQSRRRCRSEAKEESQEEDHSASEERHKKPQRSADRASEAKTRRDEHRATEATAQRHSWTRSETRGDESTASWRRSQREPEQIPQTERAPAQKEGRPGEQSRSASSEDGQLLPILGEIFREEEPERWKMGRA